MPVSREQAVFAFNEETIEAARHINGLEIYTVMVACRIWGELFRGQNVQMFSDNMATVEVFRSGKSRDPFMQTCIREILYIAAICEFQIRLKHLSTSDNRLSDLLSRWALDPKNGEIFLQETSHLNTQEVVIPDHCLSLQSSW